MLTEMDQLPLAQAAGVSIGTIRNMEAQGAQTLKSGLATVRAVQNVLERAGVEFLNHGQPGVRLKRVEANFRKWWEIHLEPEAGWLEGDQQRDFGVIERRARSEKAVLTVREFDDGEATIMWKGQDAKAIAAALRQHPNLLSGNPAPKP